MGVSKIQEKFSRNVLTTISKCDTVSSCSRYVGNKTERRYYMLCSTIGDTLRELRQSKGQTLVEAAREIGITPSALANYESNARVPRDNIKIAISDYYKRPIQKIFYPKRTQKVSKDE